ncbi:MAG TPA: hypothetical protein PK006_08700 [Saprospiraceae bacterium]|nr:hypothetical protein [Saprospiraceae bacterium]
MIFKTSISLLLIVLFASCTNKMKNDSIDKPIIDELKKGMIFSKKFPCESSTDPSSIQWVSQCITHYDASILLQYEGPSGQFAYGFANWEGQFFIHDCKSGFLGSKQYKEANPQPPVWGEFSKPKVILAINSVQ